MLCKASGLFGFALSASDGTIGAVTDILFDDLTWKVRYFAVDTGGWLNGRTVLMSPQSFTGVRMASRLLDSTLTREQVEASPPVDQHQPVSRRYEAHLHDYYGWPYYWTVAPGLGVMAPPPGPRPMERRGGAAREIRAAQEAAQEADPHLRSLKDTAGHALEAVDGDIGHLDDLILDSVNWDVKHAVIRTGSWLGGKRVVVDRRRILGVEGVDGHVRVDLSRWMVQDAPAFDERVLQDAAYETAVSAYFDALVERVQRRQVQSSATGSSLSKEGAETFSP